MSTKFIKYLIRTQKQLHDNNTFGRYPIYYENIDRHIKQVELTTHELKYNEKKLKVNKKNLKLLLKEYKKLNKPRRFFSKDLKKMKKIKKKINYRLTNIKELRRTIIPLNLDLNIFKYNYGFTKGKNGEPPSISKFQIKNKRVSFKRPFSHSGHHPGKVPQSGYPNNDPDFNNDRDPQISDRRSSTSKRRTSTSNSSKRHVPSRKKQSQQPAYSFGKPSANPTNQQPQKPQQPAYSFGKPSANPTNQQPQQTQQPQELPNNILHYFKDHKGFLKEGTFFEKMNPQAWFNTKTEDGISKYLPESLKKKSKNSRHLVTESINNMNNTLKKIFLSMLEKNEDVLRKHVPLHLKKKNIGNFFI